MKVILNKKDRIIVRNSIYCFLIQNKEMKEITWKSFLKLSSYGMLHQESEFWGMSARNFIVNNHYELDIDFIE